MKKLILLALITLSFIGAAAQSKTITVKRATIDSTLIWRGDTVDFRDFLGSTTVLEKLQFDSLSAVPPWKQATVWYDTTCKCFAYYSNTPATVNKMASRFTQLGDVPSSYTGHGGQLVKVHGAEQALVFSDELDPVYSADLDSLGEDSLVYVDGDSLKSAPFFVGEDFLETSKGQWARDFAFTGGLFPADYDTTGVEAFAIRDIWSSPGEAMVLLTNISYCTAEQFTDHTTLINSDNWSTAYGLAIDTLSFNTGTGVITAGQEDGGSLTVDIDGRYVPLNPTVLDVGTLTVNVEQADSIVANSVTVDSLSATKALRFDDYLTTRAYNSNESVTIGMRDTTSGTVKVNLGNLGYVLASGFAAGGLTSVEWNMAYNNMIASAGFNNSTGILTLMQQDEGTVTVDLDGRYLESFNDPANYAFKTLRVSGQADVIADQSEDTLTLVAGTNVTITTTGDQLTINSTASSTSFLGLTDTPSSYSGQAGKVAKVNTGETGLQFTDVISAQVLPAAFFYADSVETPFVSGSWTKVTDWGGGYVAGITANTSSGVFDVTAAGLYEVGYALSEAPDGMDYTLWSVFLNSVEITKSTKISYYMDDPRSVNNQSVVIYLELAVGDDVDLRFKTASSDGTMHVYAGTFYIKRIN